MKLCIVEDTTWNDNYLHFVHLKSASWRCYKFWDFRIQHVKHCDRCVQNIMLCPVHDRRKTQFKILFNFFVAEYIHQNLHVIKTNVYTFVEKLYNYILFFHRHTAPSTDHFLNFQGRGRGRGRIKTTWVFSDGKANLQTHSQNCNFHLFETVISPF